MNITLRQLRVFEAVVKHMSYTRASEELHLTQPAVSMQIRQLEDTVGMPLFEQLGKRIYLTEAGNEMLRYGKRILHEVNEADTVFNEMRGLHRGHLDIAVVTTANAFSSKVLAAFLKKYENISANLMVENRVKVLEHLQKNAIDLAVMGKPPASMDLTFQSFMENPLVAVASPDHPLSTEKKIPLTSLIKYTFLVREAGSGTRIAMERFLSGHGLRIHSEVEMSSNEAIKEGVQAGLGLAIVSMHTILLELETHRLEVLDVENMPIKRNWYVVHRKEKRLSQLAQTFSDFLISDASQYVFHPVRTS